MANKGYTVATPFDAMNLQSSSSGQSAGDQGISVAMADVTCKDHTGLIKTWFTAESSVQRQQIEQNQLALQAVRTKLDNSVKAATAVKNGELGAAGAATELPSAGRLRGVGRSWGREWPRCVLP
jgi:hypothetical protein